MKQGCFTSKWFSYCFMNFSLCMINVVYHDCKIHLTAKLAQNYCHMYYHHIMSKVLGLTKTGTTHQLCAAGFGWLIIYNIELRCLRLITVVYGWILFCSTFRYHLCAASPRVISLDVRWTVCHRCRQKDAVPPDRLFWLPERSVQTMPQRDGGERSIRREFSHRPRP